MTNAPLPILTAPPEQKYPPLRLDGRTYDRALACVHCGLCLPACPTFVATGHEADSPRGRIQLMRGLADGVIEASESVRHHLDLCLDCRGCETACPSGVVYHELIEETRYRLRQKSMETVKPKISTRLMNWIFAKIFVYPRRLKLALLPVRILQRIGIYGLMRKIGFFKLLPEGFQKMEQMLPPQGKLWPRRLPTLTPAQNRIAAKATIGFLGGCIGSVMFEKQNRQAVELLSACGVDIFSPWRQTCCGAIAHHNGDWDRARKFARKNIDRFMPENGVELKFITCNIAGCGSMLREYEHLLRDDAKYLTRAREFSSRVRDISEVLLEMGLPPMTNRMDKTVTYHEACHLVHAQKVSAAPKSLLALVPGLKMVPLAEADMCCGAAGTYNLQQPKMAAELADRKLRNIAATEAQTCVTGNVGCAMHIQSRAAAHKQKINVVHPVELVHQAVFGKRE
jgi:glycolate oxidase iron-sulfur subunit